MAAIAEGERKTQGTIRSRRRRYEGCDQRISRRLKYTGGIGIRIDLDRTHEIGALENGQRRSGRAF
jgi:hypothetical protein